MASWPLLPTAAQQILRDRKTSRSLLRAAAQKNSQAAPRIPRNRRASKGPRPGPQTIQTIRILLPILLRARASPQYFITSPGRLPILSYEREAPTNAKLRARSYEPGPAPNTKLRARASPQQKITSPGLLPIQNHEPGLPPILNYEPGPSLHTKMFAF